jgi:hypothetical protein
LSKSRDSGLLSGAYNYSSLEPSQELGQVTIASLSQEQGRHSFNGGAGGLLGNVKQENQPLRPFFDEWPATRDSWSEMDDARSSRTSFSTTQLSISNPRCESVVKHPLEKCVSFLLQVLYGPWIAYPIGVCFLQVIEKLASCMWRVGRKCAMA